MIACECDDGKMEEVGCWQCFCLAGKCLHSIREWKVESAWSMEQSLCLGNFLVAKSAVEAE